MSDLMRFYKKGSGDNVVLFARPAGTDYVVYAGGQNYPASAEKTLYIIQWGGSATYDSGYMQYEFEDKELAISFFNDMETGEREYSPYRVDQSYVENLKEFLTSTLLPNKQ